MDAAALRHRLRSALAGASHPGAGPASVDSARLLIQELGPAPAMAELLNALDKASSNKQCQQLLKLAEFAAGLCHAGQVVQCMPGVHKQAAAVLAKQRGDAACISGLSALLCTCLSKLCSKLVVQQPDVCEVVLIPAIRSAFRTMEPAHLAAGSSVLLRLFGVLQQHVHSQPQLLEAARRCLVLMLQQLGTGSVVRQAAGVLLPLGACVAITGISTDKGCCRRLLAVCLQAAAAKESWQVRRDALATLAALAAALQFRAHTSMQHEPDGCLELAMGLLLRTPAVEVLIAHKPAVMQVLEAARYDRIAAVRAAAVAAVAKFVVLPDPAGSASEGAAEGYAGAHRQARAQQANAATPSGRRNHRLAGSLQSLSRSAVAKAPRPRFVRPQQAPGTVLDWGVQVFAPPSPRRAAAAGAAAGDAAAAAGGDQGEQQQRQSARAHTCKDAVSQTACPEPLPSPPASTACPGRASAAAAAAAAPAAATGLGSDALQLLDQNRQLLLQQAAAGLQALWGVGGAGSSPTRLEVSHTGRVGLEFVVGPPAGSPFAAAAAGAAAAAFGAFAPASCSCASPPQQPSLPGPAAQQPASAWQQLPAAGDAGVVAGSVCAAVVQAAAAGLPATEPLVAINRAQQQPGSPASCDDATVMEPPGRRTRQRWELPAALADVGPCPAAEAAPDMLALEPQQLDSEQQAAAPASTRGSSKGSCSSDGLDALRSVRARVQGLLQSMSGSIHAVDHSSSHAGSADPPVASSDAASVLVNAAGAAAQQQLGKQPQQVPPAACDVWIGSQPLLGSSSVANEELDQQHFPAGDAELAQATQPDQQQPWQLDQQQPWQPDQQQPWQPDQQQPWQPDQQQQWQPDQQQPWQPDQQQQWHPDQQQQWQPDQQLDELEWQPPQCQEGAEQQQDASTDMRALQRLLQESPEALPEAAASPPWCPAAGGAVASAGDLAAAATGADTASAAAAAAAAATAAAAAGSDGLAQVERALLKLQSLRSTLDAIAPLAGSHLSSSAAAAAAAASGGAQVPVSDGGALQAAVAVAAPWSKQASLITDAAPGQQQQPAPASSWQPAPASPQPLLELHCSEPADASCQVQQLTPAWADSVREEQLLPAPAAAGPPLCSAVAGASVSGPQLLTLTRPHDATVAGLQQQQPLRLGEPDGTTGLLLSLAMQLEMLAARGWGAGRCANPGELLLAPAAGMAWSTAASACDGSAISGPGQPACSAAAPDGGNNSSSPAPAAVGEAAACNGAPAADALDQALACSSSVAAGTAPQRWQLEVQEAALRDVLGVGLEAVQAGDACAEVRQQLASVAHRLQAQLHAYAGRPLAGVAAAAGAADAVEVECQPLLLLLAAECRQALRYHARAASMHQHGCSGSWEAAAQAAVQQALAWFEDCVWPCLRPQMCAAAIESGCCWGLGDL